MLELLILAAAVVIFRRQIARTSTASRTPAQSKSLIRPNGQVVQLSEYADRLYVEKRWIAAEKAYLKVLKIDHKNLVAYSHLGVIYSMQKNLSDAIECFEIATRLKPSGGTFQNLGLAFYENANYMKAIAAFDKAIMFEATASRYIGLSKAYKKIRNNDKMLENLEKASKLDPSKKVLLILAAAYDDSGRRDDSAAIYQKIIGLDPDDSTAREKIGIGLTER